ncbi:hypothetical protein [Photobacterium sanguinicancri]|uniref:hypothetical protein n=1 Tax=Photobacterium sanguinicancri TaxID=875932 RepID=UPI000786E3E0|nr:hypothetical protein [Photobacterium sanguinicancri]KXI23850.1 hypothetical protein AS132_05840 [Photobacterium sanguinicancri]
MNMSILRIALLIAGLASVTGCQQEQQTISGAVHQLHLESAANFAQQAKALDQIFQGYCQSPTNDNLGQAKVQWSKRCKPGWPFKGEKRAVKQLGT